MPGRSTSARGPTSACRNPPRRLRHVAFERLDVVAQTGDVPFLRGDFGQQRLSGDALGYFEHAENKFLHDDHLAWKARAALRAGQWQVVQEAIAAMSETQRKALDTRRILLLQMQKDMNTMKTEQRERRSTRSKPSPGPNARI